MDKHGTTMTMNRCNTLFLVRVYSLSANSDQHQISPCNIDAYSTPEVMRSKDMITQGDLS